MNIGKSRITNQGQVTIPVSVMRLFGLAPGEVIEWEQQDGNLVVQKSGQFSLADIQKALRISADIHKTDDQIREGLKARVRAKHAVR